MANQKTMFGLNCEPLTETEERDKAIATVVDNAGPEWKRKALELFQSYPQGKLLTGEDIRLDCLEKNITPPHHNAWGGLIMSLVKSGAMTYTGQETAMQAKGSHGRRTRIYRKE